MTDIVWHNPEDENYKDLMSIPNKQILMETEIALRIDYTHNCDPEKNYSNSCRERIKRFAFIDEYNY